MSAEIKLIQNYASDPDLKNAFHVFISKVFPGIDFKTWDRLGYWKSNYIPYSLSQAGRISSNVGVSKMTVYVDGNKYQAVQLGAVGTLPEYRRQGLSRRLMDHVVKTYQADTDLIFLFANDSVMEFYPKFGFEYKMEQQFNDDSQIPVSDFAARKLDLTDSDDYHLLTNLIAKRQILTKRFGASGYGFITMWHILNLLSYFKAF